MCLGLYENSDFLKELPHSCKSHFNKLHSRFATIEWNVLYMCIWWRLMLLFMCIYHTYFILANVKCFKWLLILVNKKIEEKSYLKHVISIGVWNDSLMKLKSSITLLIFRWVMPSNTTFYTYLSHSFQTGLHDTF